MLTKKRYSLVQVMQWTRIETTVFIVLASIPVVIFFVFKQTWLQLPWTPIATIGTAVAFVVGFQNNAAYGRIWEARKIWGGIVNTSRSWAVLTKDLVTNEHADKPVSELELKEYKRMLTYRHLAWLTALRYEMREPRSWEVTMQHRTMRSWEKLMYIPEKRVPLEEKLETFLPKEELEFVMAKKNKPTAVLALQSKHLRELKEKKLIWEFSFLQLEELVVEMFTLQGKTERIKNFPYPRQYATISHLFIWTFLVLLPFAIFPEFVDISETLKNMTLFPAEYFIFLSVPFTVIVSWTFHTMERIGRIGENPFEGTGNDVPISTIALGIEIDLRQLLGEHDDQLPEPYPAVLGVQM